MSPFPVGNPWAFAASITGNIISFMVFLAPVPTFYKINKKKSTEAFDTVPYVVALFSATLWLYFSLLTSDLLIMTINSAGCVIEAIYIVVFLTSAPKKPNIFTIKLVIFMNVCLFGSLLLVTMVFTSGEKRTSIVGWASSTFAFMVFLSPLSVIRLVIKTKSVKYMPFTLSLFLTLSAVAWFFYGFLVHDYYVALPNILGFLFGMAQMTLFMLYKEKKNKNPNQKLPEIAMNAIVPESEVAKDEKNNDVETGSVNVW